MLRLETISILERSILRVTKASLAGTISKHDYQKNGMKKNSHIEILFVRHIGEQEHRVSTAHNLARIIYLIRTPFIEDGV